MTHFFNKGRNMKKTFSLITATIFIVSCASNLTNAELASADYGSQMSAQACAEIAEQHIRATLKDPESAKFTHSSRCTKNALKQALFDGGAWRFGYLQEGVFNAKNSYGAYVGYSHYKVLIKDGKVVDSCTVTPSSPGICK